MNSGRRFKRRFFRTSLLGRMLGDLMHRGRREQAGAAQRSMQRPGPGFALEQMEPRVLMSADIAYVPTNTTNTLTVSASSSGGAYFIDITGGSVAPVHRQLSAAGDVTINIAPFGGTTAGALLADTVRINLDTFSVLNTFVNANGGLLTLDIAGGSELIQDDHVFIDGVAASLGYGLRVHASADVTAAATATLTGDLTLASDDTLTGTSATNLKARNLTLQSAAIQAGRAVPGTGLLANADSAITLTNSQLTATNGLVLGARSVVTVNSKGIPIAAVSGAVITSASSAKINVGGASILSGKTVDITAAVDGSLIATADLSVVKLVVITGKASPEVLINGTTKITATTSLNVTAKSDILIDAAARPGLLATIAKADAAVVTTTFASGASLSVAGAANLKAGGAVSLASTSKLDAKSIADASVAGTAGASVAVSVFSGDTTASVSGATVEGASVALTAASNRVITTTAKSTPGGALDDAVEGAGQAVLAKNKAATSQGQVKFGGAVAVGTDTGATTAFLQNARILAGTGAVSVTASPVDVMTVTADGTSTQKGSVGVGVAVAISVADRTDQAYIGGTTQVTAGTLGVRVLAPLQSSFIAQATSGIGDSTKVGFAGALAVNVTTLSHQAYLGAGATLTLTGTPNVTFEARANVATAAKALPASGGTADGTGIGASVAVNTSEDRIVATIRDSAALTGAKDLSLLTNAAHAMTTEATGGGKGGVAVTPIVAVATASHDAEANLGTGALLTIGGNFSASSALSNNVVTSAKGDTKSGRTGVGISLALSIVNDTSRATTGRDLTVTAGTAAFLSSVISASKTSSKASVVGGEPDDGTGAHDGAAAQSVDNKAGAERTFSDKIAADQIKVARKDDAATIKGSQGASLPSATTSSGRVSVAGAVAINLESGLSIASIDNARAVNATGALTVGSASNVDGSASAEGSAVVGVIEFDPTTKVNINSETIDLGPSSGVKNSGKVEYSHGPGGTDIGGLADGKEYYAYDTGSGKFQLYDTQANADVHGTTGRINLTTRGTGTLHAFKGVGEGGATVGAAVAINRAEETNRAFIGNATLKVGGLVVKATRADSAGDTTSTFSATSTSGAGGGNHGLAGSLAFNVVFADTNAELGRNASAPSITITGGGDVALTAVSDLANTVKAQPSDGGGSGAKMGVGVSIGLNFAETYTRAELGNGVTLAGAKGLSLDATSTQAMETEVVGGAASEGIAVTPVIAIAVANNDTNATLGSGSLLTLTGAFSANASADNQVRTTAEGDTKSGNTGIGMSIAVTVVNDDAVATTGRDLNAGGAVTFASRTASGSQTTAKASVKGTEEDDGGNENLTITFNPTTKVNATAETIDLGTTSGLTSGDAVTYTHGEGGTDVGGLTDGKSYFMYDTGAGKFQLYDTKANADTHGVTGRINLTSVGTGTAHGVTKAASQDVNRETGNQVALADNVGKAAKPDAKGTEGQTPPTAETSSGAVAVAGAVAVNVESATSRAFIGDGRTITATGILSLLSSTNVDALATADGRAVLGATEFDPTTAVSLAANTIDLGAEMVATKFDPAEMVDTAADTIALGTDAGIKTGDRLTYVRGDAATDIGGLTDGTAYFAYDTGAGTIQLYDTAGNAATHGDTGRIDLTTTGTGTQHALKRAGAGAAVKTGDSITYRAGDGGTALGGLTDGKEYFVNVVSTGKVKLYDTQAHAEAGGADGLVDITTRGTGTAHVAQGGGSAGTSVGAAVAVNYAKDTNLASIGGSTIKAGGLAIEATMAGHDFAFDVKKAVNATKDTIALDGLAPRTGEAFVYSRNGGTAIGGLVDGATYYVATQDDGAVKLYDSAENAAAGGKTGLRNLTTLGTGTAKLTEATNTFSAEATSGAGGGKTSVAGSVAINIVLVNTDAALGATGTPTVTITGGANVALKAETTSSTTAKALPADGGGIGSNVGVGASVAVNYAEIATRARIANGVTLPISTPGPS